MRRLAAVCATLVVCITAFGAANADDLRVENYKNTIDTLVSRWATAEIALAGKLAPVLDKLAKKQALSDPSDADKARIAELQQQRDDIASQMEEESESLRLELIVVEVAPGAPKRELVILPDWLKNVIKSKGIPEGHGITIVPDADFDLKTLKLKSFSVGLQFDWM
jgi:hypothetical protein